MQTPHEPPSHPTLGALIKQALSARGMIAADLARALGRKESRVSWWINDGYKSLPPPDVLEDLRRVLGIPMTAMMRAYGYDPEADQRHRPTAPSGRLLDPTAPDARREITRAMVDDLASEDLALAQTLLQALLTDRERRDTLIRRERAERAPSPRSANGVRVL